MAAPNDAAISYCVIKMLRKLVNSFQSFKQIS